MSDLRESTTQIIRFGPMIDSAGAPLTGLTIAQADMQLSKDGAAFAQKSAAGNATHDADGYYSTTFSTTDTATPAILEFQVNVAGALMFFKSFAVLDPIAYDTKYLNQDDFIDLVWDEVLTGGTHNITNSAGKRLRQIDAVFVVAAGTAQAGAAGTITLEAGASAVDDIYQGDRVIIVGGTGQSEHGLITAYNGTTKVATMSQNWVVNPDATSEYELTPADVDIETWQHVAVTNNSGLPSVTATNISTTAIAAILAGGDVDGVTIEEVLRLCGAALAGKASGLATATAIYRALDDSKPRITATVDADGNRTAITLDVTP